MANRNTSGFGLISAGTVGSTPATQGQGKYYIDAGDTDDLFQGCSVRMKDGYIVEGQESIYSTTPNITSAASNKHLHDRRLPSRSTIGAIVALRNRVSETRQAFQGKARHKTSPTCSSDTRT